MGPTEPPLALAGLRVIDMTWVIAGPVCTRMLADQGAEVIKLESARSLDPGRAAGPWLNGINTFPDGGGTFSNYNRNKLGASLDLATPVGKELFLQLVSLSDVVVNNYRAGTMERLGLGYPVVSQANPRIIMCEMSGMGQTGPYASDVTYGQTLMAVSGCYELTGEPGGAPLLPGYTYADFASAVIGAFAIGAALHLRNRTGVGQYIDLAQFQVTASLMAESQLEALMLGSSPGRQGNLEPGAIVHDCFPCDGVDSWCTIVVRTAEEWQSLRHAIGDTIPSDPSMVVRDKLNALISAWTRTRDARIVMELLQTRGVEATRVQTARDLVDDDEQLESRRYFGWYEHMLGGEAMLDGIPYKMSLTPGSLRTGGPAFGIDNDYVFGELLGLSPGRLGQLRQSGVIG